jgi:hypothetical protein
VARVGKNRNSCRIFVVVLLRNAHLEDREGDRRVTLRCLLGACGWHWQEKVSCSATKMLVILTVKFVGPCHHNMAHPWGCELIRRPPDVEGSCEYEGVSKSSRTGRLARELQMVQLYATKRSCIAIFWVSLVSFATMILCIASQWVFIVVSLSIQPGNFWIHPRILNRESRAADKRWSSS